jgi:hypothetical protein
MRYITTLLLLLFISTNSTGQGCCSGGAGSPIAGGAATGVLQKNQMQISGNYQYIRSGKFYTENRDTNALFDNLNSSYLFYRMDYGISKKLTVSLATGYFINKSLIELDNKDTISSKGISDLILFPRYDIYNETKNNIRTEITLGLGLKIPLGLHSDSTLIGSYPQIGDIYAISPPTVQPTNGSNDLMFYSFFFRDFSINKIRLFSNALYIKRGYNSLGEKFGDYASLGLFVGKTFIRKWGVTTQIKGEWIGKIKAKEGIDLIADYNIDIASTGSKKIFFIPQISYINKSLVFFATCEMPIYQFVNGTQIGSQLQITTGFNYRFRVKSPEIKTKDYQIEVN